MYGKNHYNIVISLQLIKIKKIKKTKNKQTKRLLQISYQKIDDFVWIYTFLENDKRKKRNLQSTLVVAQSKPRQSASRACAFNHPSKRTRITYLGGQCSERVNRRRVITLFLSPFTLTHTHTWGGHVPIPSAPAKCSFLLHSNSKWGHNFYICFLGTLHIIKCISKVLAGQMNGLREFWFLSRNRAFCYEQFLE